VFKMAKEAGRAYLWWDYVTAFGERCDMESGKYGHDCALQASRSVARKFTFYVWGKLVWGSLWCDLGRYGTEVDSLVCGHDNSVLTQQSAVCHAAVEALTPAPPTRRHVACAGV
jgi:hypothetical protein